MEKNNFKSAARFDNVKKIIYNSAKIYADSTAFVIKHKNGKNISYENKSYKNLLDDINGFGTALYSLGLADKRIAVIGRNRYEWTVAHLANLMGGIVSVPLDKELKINELEDSLIRSEAAAVVYDEKYSDLIDTIKSNGKTALTKYICMSDTESSLSFYALTQKGKELIANGNTGYIDCNINPDAFSVLLFTSGTTDKSKAVMLCQRGIADNVCDMQLVEDIRHTDVNMAFLPFHHIFGSTGLIVMLACGVKTVFTDGLRYVRQNLAEYGVTLFVAVPVILDSMYKNVLNGIKKQGKDKLLKRLDAVAQALLKLKIDIRRTVYKPVLNQLGGKLRFIISGGAALDPAVAKGFSKMGIHIVQGYGLTETSPVIAAENKYFSKSGSVGIPMKSVQVNIYNKSSDGTGEICVKGTSVMLGYYNNPEATNAVLKDGWFHTGDLGYIDSEGYLFITGRQKDVIVMQNGKKVFPEELESLINRTDGVKESFVYGIPLNAQNSEKVVCKVVYDKTYFNCDEKTVYDELWKKIKDINQTLPMYKYIKGMTVTDEPLIKTSTNKIKRREEIKKADTGGKL